MDGLEVDYSDLRLVTNSQSSRCCLVSHICQLQNNQLYEYGIDIKSSTVLPVRTIT